MADLHSRFRVAARTIARDRADVGWHFARKVNVGYIGWLRRNNLGDELMYRAFSSAINPHLIIRPVPITSIGRKFVSRTNVDLLVVGGGTLLGRPEWHGRISNAIAALSPARVVTFGTGVLPLESRTGEAVLDSREGEGLRRLLADFDAVKVRGPQSVLSLRKHGVNSQAVGDLALLLNPSGRKSHFGGGADDRVLLNFANTVDRDRDPQASSIRAAVLQATSKLRRLGFTIESFSMEPEDDLLLGRYSQFFDRVHLYDSNPMALLARIQNSSLVLSERLHGSILAASQRTAFLAIPYKSKVNDFAESIGAGEFILEPSQIADPAALVKTISLASSSPGWKQVWANVTGVSDDARRDLASITGEI